MRAALPPLPDGNVIVITFDALRRDALGVYGHPAEISPNIDRFAERSLVFDRAYTVAPVSPTSFAAAFTGLLPTRVFHAWTMVANDTLAHRFTEAGFRTAAFINNVHLTPERRFDVGFELYDFHRNVADELIVSRAVDWLTRHRDERVFVWIHLLTPHAPYDYREASAHLYPSEPYSGEFESSSGPRFEAVAASEIARLRALYDGEVFYADSLFAQLMAGLERLRLFERSVVVLSSDHGEEFGEHGGFQHGPLWEEIVQLPLIVAHPAIGEPLRSDLLVSNVDLFPTLLSVAGIANESPLDGRDLTSIEHPPDTLVGISMTGGKERWASLLRERHKLILTCMPERRHALYDLVEDPRELVDRGPADGDTAQELFDRLSTILGGDPCQVIQGAARGVDVTVGLDEESIDALKALGYL